MKTSFLSEPRWSCRAARAMKSIFGEAAPGTAHVDRCPECQAFLRAGDDLDTLLRSDGAREREDIPVGLEQRLIYALHRSARTAPAPAARFSLVPLAGVLASAALVALLLFSRPPISPPGDASGAPAAGVVAADDPLTDRAWNTLAPPVALLKTNPLEEEMEFVYSDAKSALHFLALNFLPDSEKRSE